MGKIENFKEQLINGYATSGDDITIGAAIFENEPQKEVQIKIPLKTEVARGLLGVLCLGGSSSKKKKGWF
jgi:hypothetical protein